jgi:hypothetical protein
MQQRSNDTAMNRSNTPYDAVGRCVYCWSTSPPLTREHIMPRGLRGRDFLPDASCEACRLITGEFDGFEGKVLQSSMMWPLRVHMGIRNRKHRRRTTVPVRAIEADGSRYKKEIDPAELPIRALLPIFDRPGLLLDKAHGETASPTRLELSIIGDGEKLKTPSEMMRHGIVADLPVSSFVRMIAKIAHCFAVGNYGLEGFIPLLPNVVLGQDDDPYHYVGCALDQVPEPSPELHWMTIEEIDDGMFPLIIVRIRLFAFSGSPIYEVVAGKSFGIVRTLGEDV